MLTAAWLMLGDGAKWLWSALGIAAKWLFATWYRPVIAGLVIALAWVLLVAVPGLEDERDRERQGRLDAIAAHVQTEANHRQAAADAMAAAQRNKARVEAQWAAQLEEARRENLALRTDYRSRVARFVRGQGATAADPGSTDATGLPGTATLPAGFVPPAGFAVVPVGDLELAADAYAQLAGLRQWAMSVGSPEGQGSEVRSEPPP